MKENIIEIQEEVALNQKDKKIILEAGDKIRILKEDQFFDSKIGTVIKVVLKNFGFNNFGDVLRTRYAVYDGPHLSRVAEYALTIPTQNRPGVAYEVLHSIYKELQNRNFIVSDLRDTRPKWYSMKFTVNYLGEKIVFSAQGRGTSYTAILIDLI